MTSTSVQKLENMEIVETKPYSILVTGVTGFIGSKLLTRLTAAGYTVKAMSRRKLSDKPGIISPDDKICPSRCTSRKRS